MRSTTAPTRARRAWLVPIVLVLGLAACGSSSDNSSSGTTAAPAGAETTVEDELTPTSAPPTPATVTDGKATIDVTVGTDDFTTSKGTRVVSVPKGTAVTINITSSDAETYHLHGYDLEQEAEPGKTATFEFTADQTGQFDLESHITEDTLLVLVVTSSPDVALFRRPAPPRRSASSKVRRALTSSARLASDEPDSPSTRQPLPAAALVRRRAGLRSTVGSALVVVSRTMSQRSRQSSQR